MREEYELEVLEQYDIRVKSTRKIRGAFFCDTEEGMLLLRETKLSARRASLLYLVESCLEAGGNIRVDTPVFTKDGELVVTSRDGRTYLLRKWFKGRECDIRQEDEAACACALLARLHRELSALPLSEILSSNPSEAVQSRNPAEVIRSRNRELKKVRSFIRSRPAKNEFEYLFLESFEQMYHLAEEVLRRMEGDGDAGLFREGAGEPGLVHGNYNYHNILILPDGMAVTGFERLHAGVCADDLYYFLRKAMEKYFWKQKTGRRLLEAYEAVRPLSAAEKGYVALRLAYPEKYWKTADGYYRSGKAYLPEKSVEKLRTAVRQREEKRAFLADVFSCYI